MIIFVWLSQDELYFFPWSSNSLLKWYNDVILGYCTVFTRTWKFQYLGTLISKEWKFDWYRMDQCYLSDLASYFLLALSIVFSAVYCFGVFVQDASGPAPAYLKHLIKCQEAECGESAQKRSNNYQKGAAHFLETAVHQVILTMCCFPSNHTENPLWLSDIPWTLLGNNIRILILDWPKYACLYSWKLERNVRKVHM